MITMGPIKDKAGRSLTKLSNGHSLAASTYVDDGMVYTIVQLSGRVIMHTVGGNRHAALRAAWNT